MKVSKVNVEPLGTSTLEMSVLKYYAIDMTSLCRFASKCGGTP
jgi:hypothetical protein